MMCGLALSGLQDFIYDVPDEYAARRLRIRSAILNLVPAVAALRLRQQDAQAVIHYLGGGKLLASASQAACDDFGANLKPVYSWLADASGGKLGIYWTTTEGNDGNAACIQRLLKALGQAKWQAGRAESWFGDAGVCAIDTSGGLGDKEWEQEKGAELARQTHITGFRKSASGWRIGNDHVNPVDNNPEIGLLGRATANVSVSIPLYVPPDRDGSVAELHKLADEGDGAPYLAVLKMDGDGVGALLTKSLLDDPSGDKYGQTSGKLSRFFGQDVPALLQRQFDRIYLVYSGGDDLVATGHFAMVLRAALAIQQAYTALNLGTVSAGISFYTRNSPILKAVEAADHALENAKDVHDAATVGGCRLGWDKLRQAMKEIDEFVAAIKAGEINRGALQLLRQLGEPWLSGAPSEATALRWRSIAQLHYTVSRRDWTQGKWGPNLQQLIDQLCQNDQPWPRAALVATLAGWRTKSKQEQT